MPGSPNLLKDAEARIRALTREVGTLREDLRRECKRRERAVAQASQNEVLRTSADSKVHELEYTNKQLAAQLDSAKQTAQASAERDRRGMRSLREGLAALEKAVAARFQQGKELLGAAFDGLEGLKLQLLDAASALAAPAAVSPSGDWGFEPSGQSHATPGSPNPCCAHAATAFSTAAIMLTEATGPLGQLEELLASMPSSLQNPADEPAWTSTSPTQPQPSTSSTLQPTSWLHEKAELQEQMAYLKSQVIILKASAEQAAAAAVAAAARAATEAASTSPEMLQLRSSLQQARQENEMLLRDVTELEQRLRHREQQLQQQEASASQLQSFVQELQESSLLAEQHISQLQEQVLKLQSTRTRLEQENGSLATQLQEQQRELGEQSRRLASMQGAISEQHQDMRTALQLISHRDALRGALLKPANSGAAVGRLELQGTAHRNGLQQRQHSVSFLPDAGPALPRPLPAGSTSLVRSPTGWSRPAAMDYLSQRASSLQAATDFGASNHQAAWADVPDRIPPPQPTTKLLERRTAVSSRDWHAAGGMLPSNPIAGTSTSAHELSAPRPGQRQSRAPDHSGGNRGAAATASMDLPSQPAVAAQGEANLRDDMRELDQEISQLDALLKRAAGLATV